ncbi:alpha/beta fold hydrolase [Shimia sp.]|uniref:alpha/beta fold hydrolase n=1 Tax=Shimia sp. TaxID=1954381 RepID=UPI003297BEB7
MAEPATPKVDFHDTGQGPALLFVPGSFSTSTAWRGIQQHLPSGFRFVGTSLCGYGATNETRTHGDLDMDHQTRVIETVASRINQPVHLVGHSFGGTVALATALSGKVDILSISTFEANPFNIIDTPENGALFQNAKQVADAFENAYHANEHNAPGRIIDYWGGDGSFLSLPDPVQDYCRATAHTNILD